MSLQASTAELNRSFRHGFTLTFTADLLTKALSAVTVVVLIRGLTVSAYAYTTLFLTLAQFAGAAAGGGVRTRYLREEAESLSRGIHSEHPDGRFLTSLIKATLLIAAVGVCALPLVGPLQVGSKFGANASLILYAVGFAAGFGATELAIAHYQARRRFAVAGMLGLIRAGALLAAAVLISLTHQSVQHLSISFVTAMVVVGLATALPIAQAALHERIPSARKILALSREESWLSLYYLASAGFAYVDVLVASALLHQKQVASLGATLRYLTIVLAAAPALGAILRVRTAQVDMIDSHEAQRVMLLRWMRVGAAPTVVGMVLGVVLAPWLIPIIDGGRYPGSITAFQIFLVTAASSYLTAPAPSLLMAQRRYRALATTFFVGLCVNLVGDVLVARRLGVVGIAIVSSSVYVALDVVMTLDALRHASPAARKPRLTSLAAIAIRAQCLQIAVREWWGAALIRRRGSTPEQKSFQTALIEVVPPLTMLAVLAALIAAVLGFTIARSGGTDVPLHAGETQASSGLLQVALPAGWHRGAPSVQPVALSDELVLRPPRLAAGTLLVGRATSSDSAVVARSFVGTLPEASSPQPVVLGGARFTRYAAGTGTQPPQALKSVYVLPTTVGTVVGLCVAGDSGPSFSASCERILGSLRVRTGAPSATLPAGYAASLAAAINGLNAVRASAGAELAAARDARHEAIAATKLAAAHANAAAAILRLNPGPAARANAAVAAALRMTSESYASLAVAAAHADARGYANATASLRRASATLKSASQQLQAFGLRVG